MAISKRLTSQRAFSVLFCTLFAACSGNSEETTPYCSPIAHAGDNLSLDLSSVVELDGSQSGYADDCLEQSINFVWTLEAVPAGSAVDDASLTDNNTSSAITTSFVPDVPGSYVIGLTVCDYLECSDPDVAVVSVSAGDAAPIADAGPSKQGQIDTRVELDGSASYDPEDGEISYYWALSSQPSCSALDEASMYAPNSANAVLIPDCEGIYIASLTVSDGVQWSNPDYTTITVSTDEKRPIADAGDSRSLPPCNGDYIELNGNGSYDPEGQDLEFSWDLISTPTTSTSSASDFVDATASKTKFAWDVVGNYTFQLQVFDGSHWSAPDVVTYTVLATDDNTKPQANAGANIAVTIKADCVKQGSVWTCEDCRSADFELDASSSYDPDGDALTYAWTDLSGSLGLTGTNSPFPTVTTPSIPATRWSTSTTRFDLKLEVFDCLDDDSDTLKVEISCKGVSN